MSQPGGEEPQPGPLPAELLAGQRAGQRPCGRLQHVTGEGGQTRVRREDGKDVLQCHVVAGNRRADLEGRRVIEAGPRLAALVDGHRAHDVERMHRHVDGAGPEVAGRVRGQQRGRLAQGRAAEQVALIRVAGPDEVAIAGEALAGGAGLGDAATELDRRRAGISQRHGLAAGRSASAAVGTLASPTPATTADAVIIRRRDSLLSGADPDPVRAWFSLSWPRSGIPAPLPASVAAAARQTTLGEYDCTLRRSIRQMRTSGRRCRTSR